MNFNEKLELKNLFIMSSILEDALDIIIEIHNLLPSYIPPRIIRHIEDFIDSVGGLVDSKMDIMDIEVCTGLLIDAIEFVNKAIKLISNEDGDIFIIVDDLRYELEEKSRKLENLLY